MKWPSFGLFDRFPALPEDKEPVCPCCCRRMGLRKAGHTELSYECPVCHTQIVFTSRNNQRLWTMFQLVGVAVALGFAVGLLYCRFLLWPTVEEDTRFLAKFLMLTVHS